MVSKPNSFSKALASTPPVVSIDASSPPAVRKEQTVSSGAQGKVDKGRQSEKDLLAQCVSDVELWHDKDNNCYATVIIKAHLDNFSLESQNFRNYLSYRYFELTGGAPGGQAVKDCIGALQAKARHDGPEFEADVRIAKWGEAIYFDLCDAERNVVKITADGWEVVASHAVPGRFIRKNGMLPHPLPEQLMFGQSAWASLLPLFDLVNVRDFSKQQLLLGWLLGVLNPAGPYPILGFIAEQGSGKSMAAKAMRKLVDDNKSPLRSTPKNEQDLIISALNSRVIAFDNLSGVPDWLSDGLCKLTTGAGFSTRELYSNSDEVIMAATRPVMLNGIDDFSTKGDLIDRSIFVTLETIKEEERRPESELWAKFDAQQPQMMGALFSVVASILRVLPALHVDKLPRLADFALWVTAAESALDWPAGSFIESFNKNRAESVEDALEGSLVAQGLLTLIQVGQESCFTAQELLDRLNNTRGDKDTSMWPKSPRGLSNQLRRLAPGLRQLGFVVEFKRTGKRREIYLKR